MAAGVTPATVHFHFTDKRGVFLVAYDEVDTEVITRYREAVAGHDTFRDKVTALLEESLLLLRDNPDLGGFVAGAPTEIRRHEELAQARAAENKYRDLYAELADFGCLTGEVAKKDRFAVRGCLAVVISGLTQAAVNTSYLQHAEIIHGIERLLDGSLITPPPAKAAKAAKAAKGRRSAASR